MESKEGGEHNRPGQHAVGHRRKRCSSSSWKQNVCRSEKSGCGRGAGLLGRPTARAACLACMGLPSWVFVCPLLGACLGALACKGLPECWVARLPHVHCVQPSWHASAPSGACLGGVACKGLQKLMVLGSSQASPLAGTSQSSLVRNRIGTEGGLAGTACLALDGIQTCSPPSSAPAAAVLAFMQLETRSTQQFHKVKLGYFCIIKTPNFQTKVI